MSPGRIIRAALAIAALAGSPACAQLRESQETPVAVWTSSMDGTRRLVRAPDLGLEAADDQAEGEHVTVDPAGRYQSIVGFGAAMTDSSAWLFENALPEEERNRVFAELFGRDGLALGFVRVPIGASDFSLEHYSFDDMPPGEADPELAHFSMAKAEAAQIPALRAARAANPDLVLMASPWSAPGWMKDSGSLIKGRLRADAYDAFAAYLARYLAEMERRGLPVDWLTIQNEPHFEPGDYPGMRVEPAERARFIGRHLGPLLEARGQDTRILDWDHNWDQPESPLAVLSDPTAASRIAGVAWHCYAGDVAAMETVRAAHPDKDVFFTECSGGDWASAWGEVLGWMTENLIIAPSRSGSRGTMLWNLALDENHGPHKGGCGDCRGVITIDSRSGAITRNVEYYVLGHVSRFVRPGAQRIASDESSSVSNVAFRNPDGTLVLVAHNRGAETTQFTVSQGGAAFRATLPAGEVATFVWREARKAN